MNAPRQRIGIHIKKVLHMKPFQSEQIDLEPFHCYRIVLEPFKTLTVPLTSDTKKKILKCFGKFRRIVFYFMKN